MDVLVNRLPDTTSMKDKFVIYVRKSTRATDRQAQSIPDQLKELHELAKIKDYDVVKTYTESHSAFKNGKRPVFNKMIEFVRQRDDIKGVIVRHIDRSARNLIDAGLLFSLIEDGFIDQIVTPYAVFDYDAFTHFGIESVMSKEYSRQISVKVKASIKSRVERGIAPHQTVPGYMFDPKAAKGQKTHIPHPTHFSLMKKLFSMFLIGNYSVLAITKKAKKIGIKNSRGRPISRSRMHQILRDIFYCGRFTYKGKEYQGIHKRMISNSQHEAILKILSNLSKTKSKRRDFHLNGLIICGECGKSVYGESHVKHYKNGNSQEFRYYRCSKRNTKCSQPYIREKDLEKEVSNYLSGMKLPMDYITWAYKWMQILKSQEVETRENALSELNKELTLVNKRIDGLMDERFSGNSIFNQEEIEKKYRTLKIQRKQVEDNIKEVGNYSDEVNELTLKTFRFADKAKELFENDSPEKKRGVLMAIGTNLILKDRKIDIQPQIPFLLIKNAVEKLKMPKGGYEPDQNIIFEAKKETHTDPMFIWRGLLDDVRTYWANEQYGKGQALLRNIFLIG